MGILIDFAEAHPIVAAALIAALAIWGLTAGPLKGVAANATPAGKLLLAAVVVGFLLVVLFGGVR